MRGRVTHVRLDGQTNAPTDDAIAVAPAQARLHARHALVRHALKQANINCEQANARVSTTTSRERRRERGRERSVQRSSSHSTVCEQADQTVSMVPATGNGQRSTRAGGRLTVPSMRTNGSPTLVCHSCGWLRIKLFRVCERGVRDA